ncbi:hypothetical protein PAESOLCIP111_01252 [Paenibacillus solanacearum]|uniref:Uncharacterized protein n=1 Tax=Paenibacillus solanacearum TaxID=2048548 RepID=A0A916JWD7_9BACL|nr:hypothetical protein [Paenibacillus solanacearum]CAG7610527.1 hypothetical protein PAESOLCIP111_01252 [Paenibacillus solanacearum]
MKRFVCGVMILSLILSFVVTRPILAESNFLNYAINFNDNTAPYWTLDPNCSVNGGELQCSIFGGVIADAIYEGRTWSGDYSYQADVRSFGSSSGNRQHLYFNYVDASNHYYVDIGATAANDVFLKKKVGGVVTVLGTYSGAYPLTSTKATIQIEYVTGGSITVKGTKDNVTTTLFAAVQDSTFTSGKIGVGIRGSNAKFDNVTATVLSTALKRDPAYHPFDAYSPWNTPIGDGALYEPETSPGWDTAKGVNYNYTRWTQPISIANEVAPVRRMYKGGTLVWSMKVSDYVQPDSQTDANMHFIDEDHIYVVESYNTQRDGNNDFTASGYARNYLDGQGVYDTWHGTRAYGGSAIAGVIRPGELDNGIHHALASGMPALAFNKNGPNGKPFAWPASSQDAFYNNPYPNGYNVTGNVYLGSLLAIPLSVHIDDIRVNGQRLSNKARNFAKALQQFGTYTVCVAGTVAEDGAGKISFVGDPAGKSEVSSALLEEMAEVATYLQVVTNNSQQNPGGPGARIGIRPPQLPTSTLYHWDFLNNQSPGWVITGNATRQSERLQINGTAQAIHDRRDFSGDYHVQVEATAGTLSAANKGRILFNYQNDNNYYFLEFSGGGSDQAAIKKKVNGVVTTLGTASYDFQNSTVLFDVAYSSGSMSATVKKGNVTTTLFTGVADSSFSSGKIGLGGETASVNFDEIRVYRVNP